MRYPLLGVDAVLFASTIVFPNLFVALNCLEVNHFLSITNGWLSHLELKFLILEPVSVKLWFASNILLLTLFLLLRRHFFHPLQAMVNHMTLLAVADRALSHKTTLLPMNMRVLAKDICRVTHLAKSYYYEHLEATRSLKEVRAELEFITTQQTMVFSHAGREMVGHYQSVLGYANYLEEQINRHKLDPSLRYDFDDVSESSFNLKLIAGVLTFLREPANSFLSNFNLPMLIEQTMIALTPTLDRRAMKLTTIEVDLDVQVHSDPAVITQALWMMLLGTIRYAADESTLRFRCLYNRERTRSLLSIVVTELSPTKLTEEERSQHMVRQLQHLTPHMFAETIRIHANMQLASLLLTPLDAKISILPLTTSSCEICLSLPAAQH